jgi:predicted nucleic acid-binding protein
MDCLVDTNVILRAADLAHSSSHEARSAMKALFHKGSRLCLAKQSLVESWVVATRPRDVNGFGLSAQFAAAQLLRAQSVFHILQETDEIYRQWQTLVLQYQVLGKPAHDARLVAAMRVHGIENILTYNGVDFRRYEGIRIIRPDQA